MNYKKYIFIIILALGLLFAFKCILLNYCSAYVDRNKYINNIDNPCQFQVFPEYLSIPYLTSLTKYRTIHHDSFCRKASYNNIGNNALSARQNVLGYKTMAVGKICVGIYVSLKTHKQLNSYFNGTKEFANIDNLSYDDVRRYNHYASNFNTSDDLGRTIKYIDTRRSDFHIFVLRADDETSDSKCAFFIQNINNFYYANISPTETEVGYYLNGNKTPLYYDNNGGKELDIYINSQNADILIDGNNVYSIKSASPISNLCGLLFDNSSISKVDEFIVNHLDYYQDTGIDNYVESGNVKDGIFGHYCAFENRCTASRTYVKNGRFAYKFVLKKPSKYQVELDRNEAVHSTIMLNGILKKGGNNYWGGDGGNKPLDSFIFSTDVLFPDKGDEEWSLDEYNNELIIQEHHVGWTIPFSPSISINIHKGRLLINTIWLEGIPEGSSLAEIPTTSKTEYFARINTDEEEMYLESKGYKDYRFLPEITKGEWHNITLFVKLGYTYGQKPRTILYFDNKKIIDWSTPNAYNCQEYGEYLEFGIYKWDWDNQLNRDISPIKKRVIYFDNIYYYI